MICSSCHKKVKDGTSICPHCDAVLDESILGALPPEDDEGEDTPPPRPAPTKKKSSAAKRPAAARKPAPVSARAQEPEEEPEPPPREAPAQDSSGKYQNKYSQYWTDDDPPPAKPAAPKGPRSGEGVVAELGPVRGGHDPDLVDPLESLKSIWAAFLASHFEDKMTASAASMLIICAFMPWRATIDGDEMGLMGSGFFTFLLAALAIVTIWARKTDKLPALPREKFPMATIGVGGLAALVGIVSVFTSFEKGVRAGQTVSLSEPSFGVFLAIISAAGIVVGGLLTLKREKP